MLRTLLESEARLTKRYGGTVVSIAVHTGLIALAIAATARATAAPRPVVRDTIRTVFHAPPAPREKPRSVSTPQRSAVLPAIVPVRQVFIAPTIIPRRLPEIDLSLGVTDERTFDTRGTGLAPTSRETGLAGPTDGVYTPRMVDKAAAPRPGNPSPVYPSALRSAQIEGSVVAQFIVDTLGRAEPNSITFTEVSQAQFAEAVRQALLRSRYLPAMVSGRPVRQLVEQRFAFTLTR